MATNNTTQARKGDVCHICGTPMRNGCSHYEKQPAQLQPSDITLTRVKRDINGNPRYVTHFVNLLKLEEKFTTAGQGYVTALKRARELGGSKYCGKDFGGGIVFQSYNTDDLKRQICELVNNL